jgi:hypothetical protein
VPMTCWDKYFRAFVLANSVTSGRQQALLLVLCFLHAVRIFPCFPPDAS